MPDHDLADAMPRGLNQTATFTCGQCPAPVAMVATATGSMTVDAEPSREGNLLVQDARVVDVLGPKRACAARAKGAALHTNHRWTCPASLDPLALRGGRT